MITRQTTAVLSDDLLDKSFDNLTDAEAEFIMKHMERMTAHKEAEVAKDLETTRAHLKQLAKNLGITDKNALRKIK